MKENQSYIKTNQMARFVSDSSIHFVGTILELGKIFHLKSLSL